MDEASSVRPANPGSLRDGHHADERLVWCGQLRSVDTEPSHSEIVFAYDPFHPSVVRIHLVGVLGVEISQEFLMPLHFHDCVGFVGITLIVGSYFLLQAEKLCSDDLKYSVLNGVGALCVLCSISFAFNLSAFLVEAFWFLISGMGVVRYFLKTRLSPPGDEANT